MEARKTRKGPRFAVGDRVGRLTIKKYLGAEQRKGWAHGHIVHTYQCECSCGQVIEEIQQYSIVMRGDSAMCRSCSAKLSAATKKTRKKEAEAGRLEKAELLRLWK